MRRKGAREAKEWQRSPGADSKAAAAATHRNATTAERRDKMVIIMGWRKEFIWSPARAGVQLT